MLNILVEIVIDCWSLYFDGCSDDYDDDDVYTYVQSRCASIDACRSL